MNPDAKNPTLCRPVFVLAFLLTLSFTIQWSGKAQFWRLYFFENQVESFSELALEAVPEQIRNLAADYLWIRVDEYMHFGPSRRKPGAFLAGSYAANTEIMPLLEVVIRLNPRHFDAYGIMSENLALYLDRFTDGIRLLQAGILANPLHPRVHELFATIAYCYGFANSYDRRHENNRVVALRYLDGAFDSIERVGSAAVFRDVLNPVNYQVIRARFLVEQGRKEEALQAWLAAGLELKSTEGLLGEYLRRFAAGQPVPALPEDLLKEPGVASFAKSVNGSAAKSLEPGPPSLLRPPTEESGGPPDLSGVKNLSAEHDDGHNHPAQPSISDQAKTWSGILAQMALLGAVGGVLLFRSRK